MREIKFRAWLKPPFGEDENGYEMVYSLAFEEYEPLNDQLKRVKTIMQYTGLKDKNGVEIYEGDIVRWGMDGQECWTRYAVVELFPCLQFRIIFYVEEKTNTKKPTDNYIFGYSNFIYKETSKYLEVIGNIYENSDLLK